MTETPEFMNPSLALEAMRSDAAGKDAASALREAAREGKIERDPDAPRMFVSPTHPNAKFLVQKGKVTEAPFQTAALGLRPAINREGDVWAKFTSGVCATRDPIVLDWLEAHSGLPDLHRAYHAAKGEEARTCSAPIGLCKEQGPGIDVWAELKAGQQATSRRPATISPDIDVDAFMRREYAPAQTLQHGTGAQVSKVIEANAAADAERADGKRD